MINNEVLAVSNEGGTVRYVDMHPTIPVAACVAGICACSWQQGGHEGLDKVGTPM